jgi:hypothetical protein
MKFFGWGLARKFRHYKQRKNKTFLLKLMPKNSVCAEIGVFKGNFSSKILQHVKPEKLYLIDPWKNDEEEPNLKNSNLWTQEIRQSQYNLVKNKFEKNPSVNIIREKSEVALESFENNFFDWVYIDGDHSTQAVLVDLEMSLKKVKPGGFITGDDVSFEKNASDTQKNVAKAVKSFVSTSPVELIQIKNNQFIIKVKK